MKLAILTSHVIQYQAPLFKKLAAAGIDISVYFCWDFGAKRTYDPEFRKEVEWDIPLLDGFRHIFLRNFSPKPSSGFWGQVNPGIIPALIKGRYDVLLVYGWNSFTNIVAVLTAKLFGKKVLLHGESPLNQELVKPAWKRALKAVVFPILFSLVDAFLFIGRENKKFYEHYGVPEEKLFFAPYAVDNERFMKEADTRAGKRSAIRASLGLTPKDPMVLFTGKLTLKKRPNVLLRAFATLVQHNPSTHLFFVGDGELRKTLEAYVRERKVPNAHFDGFKNQTELADYYTAADIFVLPSGPGETWGLVVNEAMCFGLPVIVSDMVGCAPDLVHEGENGFVVPLGDITALAEKLEFLVRNEKERERFGMVSRHIIGGYSHEEDVKAVKAVVHSLHA